MFLVNIEDLYCFNYQASKDTLPQHAGWNFFNVQSEFQRQGVPNDEWSLTYLNTNYEVHNIIIIIIIFINVFKVYNNNNHIYSFVTLIQNIYMYLAHVLIAL